jgi:acyl-CoA thioesterase-1
MFARKLLGTLLFGFMLLFTQVASGYKEPMPPVVLIWGDSLSAAYGIPVEQGWVELLQPKLGLDYKVVNGSISGETTDGGLSRLPEHLKNYKPSVVVIELGANDGLQGKSTARMQENLEAMIKLAQEANAQVVLVGIHLPPNYGVDYTEKFDKVYKDLAEQYKLPFVPFLLEGIATDFSLMQADGLHPTAEAQSKVLENVWPILEPVIAAEKAKKS